MLYSVLQIFDAWLYKCLKGPFDFCCIFFFLQRVCIFRILLGLLEKNCHRIWKRDSCHHWPFVRPLLGFPQNFYWWTEWSLKWLQFQTTFEKVMPFVLFQDSPASAVGDCAWNAGLLHTSQVRFHISQNWTHLVVYCSLQHRNNTTLQNMSWTALQAI